MSIVAQDRARSDFAIRWAQVRPATAIIFCSVLLIVLALQATIANLPANKVFAGHDSGFYNLSPSQLIRTSSGTWDVKTDLGMPNLEALITLPYALLNVGLHAAHLSNTQVGRALYLLSILVCEFGCFALAWLILQRTFLEAAPATRAAGAFGAALAGTFNIFTAILLLYPTSGFQLGILCWPGVIALELFLLWKAPRTWMAIIFVLALTFATIGNPATTMLGIALVAATYIANGLVSRQWHLRMAVFIAVAFFFALSYVWAPIVASTVLYKGAVVAPFAADPQSLYESQQALVVRTSLAALLRFDGLGWFPRVPIASIYLTAPMIVATFVPGIVAIAALFSRKKNAGLVWILILLAMWLAKSVHPPFALNLLWVMTHVPLMAALRATYDKFLMWLIVALPCAFSLGLVYLSRYVRFGPVLTCISLILVFFSAWPFLAGRAAEPYFLTTIPHDYTQVDRIMGNDPMTRAVSLPGGSEEIHVTDWFKGGNFENLLYHAKLVNGAIFRERGISAAPLYNDYDLVGAAELPEIVDLSGIYHFQYIILHKDYLTEYRMAWDEESYKVLGPQFSVAAKRILDGDRRLEKVYEGSRLILYKVKSEATLGYAYGTYDGGVDTGYENTLLNAADSGVMDASRHPDLVFGGNRFLARANQRAVQESAPLTSANYVVQSPIYSESFPLFREQISVPVGDAEEFAANISLLRRPTYYIFNAPHGDWLYGPIPPRTNIIGTFSASDRERVTPTMVLDAQRTPREILFEGAAAAHTWTVAPFRVDRGVSQDYAATAPESGDVFAKAAALPGYNQLSNAAVPIVSLSPNSVTYSIRASHGTDIDELLIAHRDVPHLRLIDDPRISLDYQIMRPDITSAWLRLEFLDDAGRRVFLEQPLDLSDTVNAFDARDGLQGALDRHFDDWVKLQLVNSAQFQDRPFFNPEQAENYTLTGVDLIVGKTPGLDLIAKPADCGLRLYDFRMDATGLAAYARSQRYVAFSDSATSESMGLRHVNVSRSHGALVVTASSEVDQPTRIVGHTVTFYMKNGPPIVADVLENQPDYYRVRANAIDSVIYKSSIVNLTVGPLIQRFTATVHFRPINIFDAPQLRLRFWEGSRNEQVGVRLLFLQNGKVTEETPGLEPLRGASDVPPPSWISPASYPGIEPPVVLSDQAIPLQPDTGWQQLLVDLRRVAAYRLPSASAQLIGVRVTFSLENAVVGNGSEVSDFAFGFGDVALLSQSREPSGLNFARALTLDSKPLALERAGQLTAGSPDAYRLTYRAADLARGAHHVETNLDAPWVVRTIALAPPLPNHGQPGVSIRHIDDELFSVHVDAKTPFWLVFPETYHEGWRLTKTRAPQTRLQWLLSFRWLHPAERMHFLGNTYNNTWALPAGAADYVLDFGPQNFADIGEMLASLTLAVLLAILLVSALRRKST